MTAPTPASRTAPGARETSPQPPRPVSLASWQRRVLAARYRDCLLGDPATLLLLILQAPLIGWLCTVVWGSVERDTPSLYFVLCLSSVWFGCIGACRELVKERAIIEREKLFGVGPWPVVLARAQVLFMVGMVQAVLLQGAVEWKLSLKGPMGVQLLALTLASWCGVGLGLCVSAFAGSQERAVGAVPLLLLPQVLFSEMALPPEMFSDTVKVVEKAMPVRWAWRVFQDLALVEIPWPNVLGSLGALLGMALLLVALASIMLTPRREV